MYRIAMLVAGVLLSASVHASDSGITVSDAWVRATAPGQDSGAVEFSIASKKAAKLVTVASPLAEAVEIHGMTHENGSMKMRAIEFIALPAGKLINLKKSGYHVMLIRLKQPLKAGDSVPLTLTIEFAGNHKVAVEVRAAVIAQGASHEMHDMTDMGNMHEH